MKLLLTSAGITNASIAQAVLDLAGLPAEKIKIAFVPTASNMESDDKGWLIDDLRHLQEQGYESIDIVDIAALPKEVWLPRLKEANVLCFGGGEEQYLAKVMRETEFTKEVLADLLEARVFMGISAGSMITGVFMSKEVNKVIYPEQEFDGEMEDSLRFVNLMFIPHLNSSYFPTKTKENIESILELQAPLYALDDETALKVVDGEIEIIGDGESSYCW